jgi:hypothetical protein
MNREPLLTRRPILGRAAAVSAAGADAFLGVRGGPLARRVTLVLGGAIAGWLLLAITFVDRLNLAPVTIGAASAILVLLGGTLLYAVRLGALADRGEQGRPSDTQELRRGIEHLQFVASLCQLLGLIGTVAGFLLVLTGGFATLDASNQSAVQHLLSRVSEGSATALVSTFTGVVASVLISLVAHMLAPATD